MTKLNRTQQKTQCKHQIQCSIHLPLVKCYMFFCVSMTFVCKDEPGHNHVNVWGGDDGDEGYGGACREDIDDEEVKYRMDKYENNPEMQLDGNDMMKVMDCDECGPMMTEYLRQDCDECGTGWVREDYTLTVIGNDVIALFPSLDSANTGRIVREEVQTSTIKIEGFNVRLGVRYISMNREYTGDLGEIEHLLPYRVTKPGVKPGMKCKWVNSKEIIDDDGSTLRQDQLRERKG